MVSAVTNYIEIKWSDSIDSKDENNDLEDALDIIRGKTKKRKISLVKRNIIKMMKQYQCQL